jgi:hypothetical protein
MIHIYLWSQLLIHQVTLSFIMCNILQSDHADDYMMMKLMADKIFLLKPKWELIYTSSIYTNHMKDFHDKKSGVHFPKNFINQSHGRLLRLIIYTIIRR